MIRELRHARTWGAIALVSVLPCASAAAQVPAGPEFQVSADAFGAQTALSDAVAAAPNGDFVVVWTDAQDGSAVGLLGRRFDVSGNPQGGEFQVNTYTPGVQYAGGVTADSNGNFVVVWASQAQDGSGYGVFGQRFDADGVRRGTEFRVNGITAGSQLRPAVAANDDGNFVVAWVSPSITGILAQRFDAAGTPRGSELFLGQGTEASVGIDGAANSVVVWTNGSDILGRRVSTDGSPGTPFIVNLHVPSAQVEPRVDMSRTGDFVVAWSGAGVTDPQGIFARRFDANGAPVGPDIQVNSYTTGRQHGPAIDVDVHGNFVVTWTGDHQTSGDVFGQRFDASGARRGAEFLVNTYTTFAQRANGVAADAVGNIIVTWDSDVQDGDSLGLFGQRFGGLRPSALAVNTTGNLVLEPGETVDVRPSWHNITGADQTFSGTLTGIAGPAGPTYAITDSTADYGTVSDGGTAQCTDCYAVSVSNPATRPAVHWDASALERILPDTLGQQMRWALHVGRSFTDVLPANPFYRFIETLLHRGVTGGCGPTQYCPASATTRDQMAVFVLIAKEGTGFVPPACTTPVFADVPASSPFCRWIEELARRGVVSGCGGGNYCPSSAVSREQMAVFVLRTLDPTLVPPACVPPNLYTDVPAFSPFCAWIEELTRREVVTGCGGGNYCPAAAVTREQMGVFISVTFGLTLYGP